MAKEQKTLYLTIHDLKELGLLSKSQKKNLKRKNKRYKKRIANQNEKVPTSKQSKKTYDNFGEPKASSKHMKGSVSSELPPTQFTHTANLNTEIASATLRALEEKQKRGDDMNPQFRAIADDYKKFKNDSINRYDSLRTLTGNALIYNNNQISDIGSRFDQFQKNSSANVPLFANSAPDLMGPENYKSSSRFANATAIQELADDAIDETLKGDGGAVSTAGSDHFENDGAPVTEVNLSTMDDNKPIASSNSSVAGTASRSSSVSAESGDNSDYGGETFTYDVFKTPPMPDRQTEIAEKAPQLPTVAEENYENSDDEEFEAKPMILDTTYKNKEALIKEYMEVAKFPNPKVIGGTFAQLKEHIKKQPELENLRNLYLIAGGNETDPVYKSDNMLTIKNATKKIAKDIAKKGK